MEFCPKNLSFFKKIKCSKQPKKQNKLNFYLSLSGVPNVRGGWVGSIVWDKVPKKRFFLTPSLTQLDDHWPYGNSSRGSDIADLLKWLTFKVMMLNFLLKRRTILGIIPGTKDHLILLYIYISKEINRTQKTSIFTINKGFSKSNTWACCIYNIYGFLWVQIGIWKIDQ